MACLQTTPSANVEDYLPMIGRIAKHYASRCCVPCEDLEQEACIAALDALRRFDPSRGTPIEAWLFLRIREHLVKVIQKDSRQRPCVMATEALDSMPARDEVACTVDTRSILAKLQTRHRQALAMWIGLDGPANSYTEIGSNLGVSKQRAHALVRAGLARLRRQLQAEEEAEGTPEGVAYVRS